MQASAETLLWIYSSQLYTSKAGRTEAVKARTHPCNMSDLSRHYSEFMVSHSKGVKGKAGEISQNGVARKLSLFNYIKRLVEPLGFYASLECFGRTDSKASLKQQFRLSTASSCNNLCSSIVSMLCCWVNTTRSWGAAFFQYPETVHQIAS